MFYRVIRPGLDPKPFNAWPGADLKTYEVMTTATFEDGILTRYHGFHAVAAKDPKDGALKLQIHGRLLDVKISELDDRRICDDPTAIRGEIVDPDRADRKYEVLTSASTEGEAGAVFLRLEYCGQNGLRQGKIPRGADGIIIAPNADSFAVTLFPSLPRARVVELKATTRIALRDELIDLISKMGPNVAHLDFVSHAAYGVQTLVRELLGQILADQLKGNTDLVQLIRSRFSSCRLLGCRTAAEDGQTLMFKLRAALGIPIMGTTRGIGAGDFNKYGFVEFAPYHDMDLPKLISTGPVSDPGRFDQLTEQRLADGWYQENWLGTFPQAVLDPSDLVATGSSPRSSVGILDMPTPVVGSKVAVTDRILAVPDGTVTVAHEGKLFDVEVQAWGTLLRFRSKQHGSVYLNVSPSNQLRRAVLFQLSLQ